MLVCKSHEGTFIYAIWACPLVFPFWREIIKTIQEWLGTPVPVSAQLCLLGDRSVLLQISKPAFALARTGFVSAARIILRNWKGQLRPEYREWVTLMTENASFELMIANLYNCKNSHHNVWKQFLSFIKGTSRTENYSICLSSWSAFEILFSPIQMNN